MKIQFKNVDIIPSMRAILDKQTKYYKSDFDLDIMHLQEDLKNGKRLTYYWICRDCGTWFLNEEVVFIKDTSFYNTFMYYTPSPSNLLYRVEVTNHSDNQFIGNIWETDYKEEKEYIKKNAIKKAFMVCQYNDHIDVVPIDGIVNNINLISYEIKPEDPEELEDLVSKNIQRYGKYKAGDLQVYLLKKFK